MTIPPDVEKQLQACANDLAARVLEEVVEYAIGDDSSTPKEYRLGFAFLAEVLRWRIEFLRSGVVRGADDVRRLDRAIRLGERQ